MFDAQNDRRQEPLEDKPKASLADAKFKKQIAVIVAVAVLLIVGIIAGAVTAAMRGDLSILPDSSQDEGSGFLGLKTLGHSRILILPQKKSFGKNSKPGLRSLRMISQPLRRILPGI